MSVSPTPPDLHARIVAALTIARRDAKLRQVDLAKRLGWQQAYVWALAIVTASARKLIDFLPRLPDSGRVVLLMLNDNVLAIIRACSQS